MKHKSCQFPDIKTLCKVRFEVFMALSNDCMTSQPKILIHQSHYMSVLISCLRYKFAEF